MPNNPALSRYNPTDNGGNNNNGSSVGGFFQGVLTNLDITQAANLLGQAAASGSSNNAPAASHTTAIWAILGAGVLLIVLADFAPHLVNGVLILILAGVILRRSDVWVPWMQGVQKTLGG